MELMIIKGKNVQVPEALHTYAERKIGRLTHHLQNVTEAKIELTRERTRTEGLRHVAQVTLDSNGTLLRGEKGAADFYAAIDAVADVLDRQIKRYKGRLYQRRKGAPPAEAMAEEEPRGEVVRIKRFPVKPMSTEEAIEQMELLGHDFFLFFDEASEKFCVAYRRNDGDYGVLEPELS